MVEIPRETVGPTVDESNNVGPVINERQLSGMLAAVDRAREQGARVLIGGERLSDADHAAGYYMAPTVIEGADPDSAISTTELFGPILCIFTSVRQLPKIQRHSGLTLRPLAENPGRLAG